MAYGAVVDQKGRDIHCGYPVARKFPKAAYLAQVRMLTVRNRGEAPFCYSVVDKPVTINAVSGRVCSP